MGARPSADAVSALTAERLKYVTEHFHQLQGLTYVALGAWFLLIDSLRGVYFDFSRWLLLLYLLFLFAMLYLPKYYRRRFGWIDRQAARMTNKQFVFLLLALLMLLFFGRPTGRYADSILADVQSMIPAHPVTFFPAIVWSVYLCLSFRRNPHQEDFYRMYFLASGALAWVFTAICPIWHPDAVHPALWRFLNTGWVGLSFMALGLYDHLTLVRLMPRRMGNEEDDSDGIKIG